MADTRIALHHDKDGNPLQLVEPISTRFVRTGIRCVTDKQTGSTYIPQDGQELADLLNSACDWTAIITAAERNRLKALNAELLAALETLVRGRPTTPPNHAVLGKDSVAYMNWLAFEAARAAIAKAKE